jgi:molybdopterin molybdotransferase
VITPEKALQIILDNISVLKPKDVHISEILGLVVAKDVFSEENIPPFDNSAMDGFAVRSEDTKGASPKDPVTLILRGGAVAAGTIPEIKLKKQMAMEIMTGAPVPQGADTVIPVEFCKKLEDKVIIYTYYPANMNIRKAGEDIKKDDKVLEKNKIVYPADIGVLASLGIDKISVFPKPNVAILCTGDELVDIKESLTPGKIRNSNLYSLSAQVKEVGALPLEYGIIKDDPEEIKEKITDALEKVDLIITSGGVSMGEYDYVKNTITEMGADLKFWKIAQRPGLPMAFWILDDKPIFGLPGNPVSVMVCFENYIRPSIFKMMNKKFQPRQIIKAKMAHPIKNKKGRVHFVRVIVYRERDELWAKITGDQGSGILKSMARANGILAIPFEKSFIERGEYVEVKMLKPILKTPIPIRIEDF